eukprot:2797576-Amphidinium_carterae.1
MMTCQHATEATVSPAGTGYPSPVAICRGSNPARQVLLTRCGIRHSSPAIRTLQYQSIPSAVILCNWKKDGNG